MVAYRRAPSSSAWSLATSTGYTPVELLRSQVVQEEIGGVPVVIFGDHTGGSASGCVARLGDRALTFATVDGEITDCETGSTWDRRGRASAAALAGSQLVGAPSRTTFWFAYVAAYPGIELWAPGS